MHTVFLRGYWRLDTLVIIILYSWLRYTPLAPVSALKATYVQLPSSPLNLSLSSDETTLSVCLSDGVSPKAAFAVLIYNIAQLTQVREK